MRLITRYRLLFGTLLILVGFSIRVFLYHDYTLWQVKNIVAFLCVGLGGVLYYFQFEEFFPKLKKIKNAYALKIIGILLSAPLILAFIFGGKELNKKLWLYHTNNDVVETWGTLSKVVNSGATREEKSTFYVVSFVHNQETRKSSVPKDYLDYSLSIRAISLSNNTVALGNLEGSKVKIKYSKRHPSFLNITDIRTNFNEQKLVFPQND